MHNLKLKKFLCVREETHLQHFLPTTPEPHENHSSDILLNFAKDYQSHAKMQLDIHYSNFSPRPFNNTSN